MVVFIGEFFGTGPYVIDTIINISKLKRRFEDRVKIILGYNDINKLRFKYELDRPLISQNITEWPCNPNINIKTEFNDDKKAYVFGREVNFKVAIEKELKRKQEKSLILILYERIKQLILQTQDGIEEFSFLIDKNLYDLYFLAESDQNIELQLYTIMLSTFLIVYPFVFDIKYYTYLSKQEIENIINILIENIQINIENEMKFRDDIYIRKIYDLFQKIKTLTSKDTKYQYGFTCPLNIWRTECNYLFKEAKLIDYDFVNCRSIFTHNFSILYLLETYLPFLRYIYKNSDRTEDKEKKYTNVDYYKKYMEFFDKYCKIKSVKKLFEVEKTIQDDPIKYNEQINKKISPENITQDVFQAHSSTFMTGGNNDDNNNNNKSKKKKIYINEKESLLQEEFTSLSAGDLLKSSYNSIDFRHLIDEINRYYKRDIIEEPRDSKNELFLNLMVSMQVMYIVINKVSNNCNYLHPYKLAQLRDLRKILHFKGYYNIFIGGYISGLQFPLVIENNFCANLVFPHITLVKKEEIPIYKFSKFMLSDYDDFKFRINIRLKNLPIVSINTKGNIIITSLTNNGIISNLKTFLGEYFSHSFDDMFLSHKDNASLDLSLYEKIRLNVSLLREQVNGDLLPEFNCNRVNALQNKTYLTQDLTYFIKLESKDKKIDNMYLILDLRKRGEIDKIGTYFGNIHEWFGFFWDEKNLYQKTISKPDYDNLKYYLKQHTSKLVNLYYDKTKEYINLNDILNNNLRNNRINNNFFNKYLVYGFDKSDFDTKPGILPGCSDTDKQSTLSRNLIQHEYLDFLKKEYNKKFNPKKKEPLGKKEPTGKKEPPGKKEKEKPPDYNEIDFEWLRIPEDESENYNNSIITKYTNTKIGINKITVPVYNYQDKIFKELKGGSEKTNIPAGSFGQFISLGSDENFGYKIFKKKKNKDIKKEDNCNTINDTILNEILINLHISINEDEISDFFTGKKHISRFYGLLEIRLDEGTEICYKFYSRSLPYTFNTYFSKKKKELNNTKLFDDLQTVNKLEDFDTNTNDNFINNLNPKITDMGNQIFSGLKFLHSKDIYHLDISSGNIIIEEHSDGKVYCQIIDFGVSLYADKDSDTDIYTLPNHKPSFNIKGRYKSLYYTYAKKKDTDKGILDKKELKKSDLYSCYFLFFFLYIRNNSDINKVMGLSKPDEEEDNESKSKPNGTGKSKKVNIYDLEYKLEKLFEVLDINYYTNVNESGESNMELINNKQKEVEVKLLFYIIFCINLLCTLNINDIREIYPNLTNQEDKNIIEDCYKKLHNTKDLFDFRYIILIINLLNKLINNIPLIDGGSYKKLNKFTNKNTKLYSKKKTIKKKK